MKENFVIADSNYGRLIINKNCHYQLPALLQTRKPHIQNELDRIFEIVKTLPNGSIILDGGANSGLFCIPICHTFPNINLIAFEPQRFLYLGLCGTIALNEITNCYVHNLALGDELAKVTLPIVDYGVEADYGTITVSDYTNLIEHDYMRNRVVDCITIDSLDLPRLEFLKLDVEGYEIKALHGAKETIKKFKPYLWVEYHLIGLDKIENTILEISNYSFEVMDTQNLLCRPI